mgnify:CR=1 FL=1
MLLGALLTLGISITYANTALDPVSDTASTKFAREVGITAVPDSTSTSSTTRLMQSGGGNFQGIIVNQKESDTASATNYLQFYDYVNAWGDLNTLKGIWNVSLTADGLVSYEEQNHAIAKKILGIEEARADNAINPSPYAPPSTRYSIDVNGNQYPVDTTPGQQNQPFLQAIGGNFRGIIVNQNTTDTKADDHSVDIFDYTNVWGYMNVKDGMWNIPPLVVFEATASSTTPPSSSVGTGSTNFSFAKLNFSASKGDVTITSLTIGNYGTSTSSDVKNLNIYDGLTQIGTTQNLSGSNTATFSGLNIFIPENSTKILTIKATVDVCAVAGRTVKLGIESSNPTTGTPQGNTMTISDLGVCPPVLTISPTGQPASATVPKGMKNYLFADLNFSAANGNITVTSITAGNLGTATSTDVINIKIFEKRDPILGGDIQLGSTVAYFNKGAAVFNGLSWVIPKNGTKTLRIKAEVPCTAVTGKTIKNTIVKTTPLSDTPQGNTFTIGGDCDAGGAPVIIPDGSGSGGGATSF